MLRGFYNLIRSVVAKWSVKYKWVQVQTRKKNDSEVVWLDFLFNFLKFLPFSSLVQCALEPLKRYHQTWLKILLERIRFWITLLQVLKLRRKKSSTCCGWESIKKDVKTRWVGNDLRYFSLLQLPRFSKVGKMIFSSNEWNVFLVVSWFIHWLKNKNFRITTCCTWRRVSRDWSERVREVLWGEQRIQKAWKVARLERERKLTRFTLKP